MASDEGTTSEVRRLADDWMAAVQRRDIAKLEQLLAAEYVLLAPDIGRMPRQIWLAAAQGAYEIMSFAYDDVEINIYGTTAVMRSRYHQEANYNGVDRSRTFLVTDVWVHRDGRWQVVSRHTSYAP